MQVAIRDRQAQKFTCLLASFTQKKSHAIARKMCPVCHVEARSQHRVVNRFRRSRLSCLSRHVLGTPTSITCPDELSRSIDDLLRWISHPDELSRSIAHMDELSTSVTSMDDLMVVPGFRTIRLYD